jgi:hypothetical protein
MTPDVPNSDGLKGAPSRSASLEGSSEASRVNGEGGYTYSMGKRWHLPVCFYLLTARVLACRACEESL